MMREHVPDFREGRTSETSVSPTTTEPNTEAAILARVVDSGDVSLTPEAARALLALRFSELDQRRMKLLLTKAKGGDLTEPEARELDSYRHVGHLLELLWSRARVAPPRRPTLMDATLERLVRDRAGGRCEYCRLPQDASPVPFEVDHVIARKHGGGDDPQNTCLACFYCNSYKGPNIAGIDHESGAVVRLFTRGGIAGPVTSAGTARCSSGRPARGRATIAVLQINEPRFVAVRRALIDEGRFPESSAAGGRRPPAPDPAIGSDQLGDRLAAVDDLHRAAERGGVLGVDVDAHGRCTWWRSGP